MPRAFRLLLRLLAVIVVLAGLALLAALVTWRGSLADLDGDAALAGLSAPATVERDALGVATVQAANEVDAARALGFVHAQERFFEMDLLRRSAAGELSALFGPMALERDKQLRVHRLRARLAESIGSVAGDRMPVLEAYRDGVNAGLAALRTRPWPYLLLETEPEPWAVADTALVGYAMFFDLQDESNSRELALWRIRQVLPPELYALVARDGSEWDAPLIGEPRGNAPLPGPDVLDLRKLDTPWDNPDYEVSEPAAPGSNNFAVAGSLTADRRAIVANDMHLGLRAPSLWFRARLRYADARAPGGRVEVSGFTLPGIPAVIVGSNGHVAWGFTNSYGDWLDFYRVDWANADRTRYRVPGGDQQALRVSSEWIQVKGGLPVELKVRETRWGPITAELDDKHSLALRWTAQLPGALNFGLADLAWAGNLDAGLAAADLAGIPGQNLVIGDRAGRIAWRLTGQIPNRVGECAPGAVHELTKPCRWAGWLAPTENPSLADPADGRLWTANARVVDGAALALVGDAGYANGARARQIRDGLRAKERFTEADLLAIQLDDRALFLERWWTLLQAEAKKGNEELAQLARGAATWDGHASVESTSYRLVRAWRLAVIERLQNGLLAPAQSALGKDFVMPDLPQMETVAWPLLQERPAHLLPRKFSSWDVLLADAASEVNGQIRGPAAARTWGSRNRAAICHPLAGAMPDFAKSWLCMPADPLPGDGNMPRVQGPAFGASERMVVAPGHEADGLLHMPGGQSGHPLSPFWGAGHDAWVRGEPTPFLPGEAEHRLELRPET